MSLENIDIEFKEIKPILRRSGSNIQTRLFEITTSENIW